jgi:hypothetical protein
MLTQKHIHLLNIFFFKKLVIEMLLNSDIQKKIFKWFYTFKRKQM